MTDKLSSRVFEELDRLSALVPGPVAIAVSGGSDSTAMLLMTATWAQTRQTRLFAFTVDHGLRPGAAAEAEQVSALCKTLAVSHRTLVWNEADRSSAQAKARRARYALLGPAARAAGAGCILTGHTLDDDIETFLIRARAGSGWYGLAGIMDLGLVPVWPEGRGLFVARPLLGENRAALRAWLSDQGRDWIDDPSNEKTAYERIRMRQLRLQTPGLDDRVATLQNRFKCLRIASDRYLSEWIERAVTSHPDGTLEINEPWPGRNTLVRALSWLCQIAAGRSTSPRAGDVRALAERLSSGQIDSGATLGGARFWKRRGSWWIGRDPGGIAPMAKLSGGDIWDGRFLIDPGTAAPLPLSDLQPNARAGVPSNGSEMVASHCLMESRVHSIISMLKKKPIENLPLN